jgi:quercetin dioxygenase-like cupin family protein
MEWQSGREGARFKLYREGSRQIRLVEFTTGEVVPELCDRGHVGLVLSGSLDIECGGRVVSYNEGDGIFIPSGSSSAHRATKITPGTRLLMVEDIPA